MNKMRMKTYCNLEIKIMIQLNLYKTFTYCMKEDYKILIRQQNLYSIIKSKFKNGLDTYKIYSNNSNKTLSKLKMR